MATKDPTVTKLSAIEVIRETRGGAQLNKDELELLAVAVEHDLVALAAGAAEDQQRLAKLEKQTSVLADAVIAIANTDTSIESAVQAVKDTVGDAASADKP